MGKTHIEPPWNKKGKNYIPTTDDRPFCEGHMASRDKYRENWDKTFKGEKDA